MTLPRRQQRRAPSTRMPMTCPSPTRSQSPQMPMPTPNQPQWPAGVTPPPAEYSDVNQIIQSDQQARPDSSPHRPQQRNTTPQHPNLPSHHGRPQVHRYDSSQYITGVQSSNKTQDDSRRPHPSGSKSQGHPASSIPENDGRSTRRPRRGRTYQINESDMIEQLNEGGGSLRHPTVSYTHLTLPTKLEV